jgi:hypothetical protein
MGWQDPDRCIGSQILPQNSVPGTVARHPLDSKTSQNPGNNKDCNSVDLKPHQTPGSPESLEGLPGLTLQCALCGKFQVFSGNGGRTFPVLRKVNHLFLTRRQHRGVVEICSGDHGLCRCEGGANVGEIKSNSSSKNSRPPPCRAGKSRPNTMPPMSLKGIVTKVGVMRKTATVTVSRWVIHKQTGKVRTASCLASVTSNKCHLQRIERSKKYLTHDENGGASYFQPPRGSSV